MVDKIDGPNVNLNRRSDVAARQSSASVSSSATEVSASSSVANDPQSQPLFSQLKSEVASANGIDQQKVDQIKAAISRGEFVIDPERVAQAVTQMEQLLSR